MLDAVKAEHQIVLGPLEAERDRLMAVLKMLLAGHEADKQNINDNLLVLEHLGKRMDEIDLEIGRQRPYSPMMVSQLVENFDVNGGNTIQRMAAANALHFAVEAEIECARLEKIIRQASLAVRQHGHGVSRVV